MGSTEEWRRVLVGLARVVLDITGEAEPRGQRSAVACSLCDATTLALLPVARGQVCPFCAAMLNLELMKNRQARALLDEVVNAKTSLQELAHYIQLIVAENQQKTAENGALRERVSVLEAELASKGGHYDTLLRTLSETEIALEDSRSAGSSMDAQIEALRGENEALRRENETLSRGNEALHRENEALRRELESRVQAAVSAATDLLAVPWILEFKPGLHPKIFQHFLDLVAMSGSSAMAKAIEEFLRCSLRAASRGTKRLEGSTEDIIVPLEKEGLIRPDSYNRRVLSWLVRRTPLVTRKTTTPVTYIVMLDWFSNPPQECLEHHRLRRV
jgi:regulator of replication initiation timing